MCFASQCPLIRTKTNILFDKIVFVFQVNYAFYQVELNKFMNHIKFLNKAYLINLNLNLYSTKLEDKDQLIHYKHMY